MRKEGEIFIQNDYEVEFSSVTEKSDINEEANWIGFCIPVYAFEIPIICRYYLLSLSQFNKSIKKIY